MVYLSSEVLIAVAPLIDRARHDAASTLRPGSAVAYVGVINDEEDLEREGVVIGGPNAYGDVLVEWVVVGDAELRREPPSALELVLASRRMRPEPAVT